MTTIPMFVIIHMMSIFTFGISLPPTFRIGAIFHEEENANYVALEKALKVLQKEQVAPSYQLQSRVIWVNASTDCYKTYIAACKLIEEGVIAIFGPGNPSTSSIVSSVTSRYNIPHIEYIFRRIDDAPQPSLTTVNMYPDTEKIADTLSDLLDAMNWPQYTVLYETNDGLSRLQKVLMKHGPKDTPVTVRQLQCTYDKITKEPDYRPILKEIANSTEFNLILDIEPKNVRTIINQAQEVKILQDYYNYIITSMHSSTELLVETLNKSRANVTAIQFLSNASVEYHLETVESALIFDAVFLLNDAIEILKKLNENNGYRPLEEHSESLSCRRPEKYTFGHNITSLMREISTIGRMTGPMKFLKNGGRSFKLTFREFREGSVLTSGFWENGQLIILSTQKERERQSLESIKQRKFRVTTRIGEPYIIELGEGVTRGIKIENKYYEGYAIDLIHAIAEMLKFQYTFELVPDGEYGTFNQDTKQWNGLIGRLLNREADLAICDLTITEARGSVVDFTSPFMNLGISILYAKPENKEPELFAFLSPFSTDVWIYMATAFVAISVLLIIQARITPEEWNAAHPCRSEPEELENNFNLMNSLWLMAGSLVQQGSDILPRAPSIRMVAGMWWFFVLIMVSSYTANLAAFLTATKMEVSIKDVEELAAQTKIKYGSIQSGSTASFFKNSNVSTYKKMWTTMSEARPNVFEKKNEYGVERVAKGKRKYAFLMESTGIEYAIERNCNLMQVGSLLDQKGYGIAMPPNSPYRSEFSEAVLKLQEMGILHELKEKWWLKDSKNCSANEPPPSSGELTMAHIGGVFLVLIFGLTLGVIFAIFECIWNVRRVAVEEKITPLEAFMAELKFALNVTARTKPVQISKCSKTSSGGSGSAGEFIREVSTERSIVGSFLRLDIIGNMDRNVGSNMGNKNTPYNVEENYHK